MTNYNKLKRNYTDYVEMIKDILESKTETDPNKLFDVDNDITKEEIFDVCDNVFDKFSVSKAEYFTNPKIIPELNLEGKCYDLGCGIGFWSMVQGQNNDIDIIGLDINEDFINMYNEYTNYQGRVFDIKKDRLSGEFSLFGNPPFDYHYKKHIIRLMKKAKVSYLIFPDSWLKDLTKENLKAELVGLNDIDSNNFTGDVDNKAGYLFRVYQKQNADNSELYEEINKSEEDEKEIDVGETWEIIENIFDGLEKEKKELEKLKDQIV